MEWLKLKRLTIPSVEKDTEEMELYTLIVKMYVMLQLWKTVWQFLKKLNINLQLDLAIPLIGIYPKENIHTRTCTHVHSSFTCKNQQLRTTQLSSIGEWINTINTLYIEQRQK